jgi:hypothetical protein
MFELCATSWLGPIVILLMLVLLIITFIMIHVKNKRIVQLINDRQKAFHELATIRVQKILPDRPR